MMRCIACALCLCFTVSALKAQDALEEAKRRQAVEKELEKARERQAAAGRESERLDVRVTYKAAEGRVELFLKNCAVFYVANGTKTDVEIDDLCFKVTLPYGLFKVRESDILGPGAVSVSRDRELPHSKVIIEIPRHCGYHIFLEKPRLSGAPQPQEIFEAPKPKAPPPEEKKP